MQETELKVLSEIREALGVGEKPMLSELPGIIRELKEQDRVKEITLKEIKSELSSHAAGLIVLRDMLNNFLSGTEGNKPCLTSFGLGK